jgi:hypothetical protein
VSTSTSSINSISLRKPGKLAIAIVSALALVMALLTPALPANATGSPTITSVTPTSGPAGTSVTITGDVAGVTAVEFGSQAGTSLAVAGAGTSLTVVAPAQTSGTNPYAIKLIKADGSVTLNAAFTYRSSVLPVPSSVSPTSGPATGHNAVTISGSGFTGATAVRFGTSNAVSFSILSDSRIVAFAPEGTSGATVRIFVDARGTSTSVVNYTYKPSTCVAGTYRITKFGFNSSTLTAKQKRQIRATADEFGILGCEQVDLVKYTGKRAGSSATYKAYLTLQNKRANAVSKVLQKRLTANNSQVFVNVVKRANQKSQARNTRLDSRISYRNVLLRVASSAGIDTVYPAAGPTVGGGTVVITGSGFSSVAATGAVRFGSTVSPSYTVNATGTKITATVPAASAGSANITVQTGVAGTATSRTFSRGYTYVSPPTIIAPATVPSGSILGGQSITITGTNFTGVTAVRFGAVNALSYTVSSSTSITAVAPPGAVGSSPVISVVTAGGSTSGGTFNYVSGPSISGMAWESASSTNKLTITGVNLLGANLTVAGSGSLVVDRTNSTATTLIATGVAQPTTTSALVTVTTTAGVATKGAVKPAITNVVWAAPGTLTITGTGLAGATAVAAAGATAGTISNASSTSVVVTGVSTPPNNNGVVTVTTPLGTSADFNFIRPLALTAVWTENGSTGVGSFVLTGRNLSGATVTISGSTVAFTHSVDGANHLLTSTNEIAHPADMSPVVITISGGLTFSFFYVRN